LLADALRMAESDPEHAVRLLETIVALYGMPQNDGGASDVDSSRQAVVIAQRNLKRLAPLVERQRADHRAVIVDAIARANELEQTDSASARRIREALVRQYGDTAWAAALLVPVRERLGGGSGE
jgi:hypothetical protein